MVFRKIGAPGWTRTSDLRLRSPLLYPTELPGQAPQLVYLITPITYNGAMQTGPYITERLLPKIIEQYCVEHDISFQSFSGEWVLRLQTGADTRWIVGYKFDVNRSASAELAQDKVATYHALAAANVPAIPHYLVRSLPHEFVHEETLHEKLANQAVVIKPLEGTGGRQVEHFPSSETALAAIRASDEPAWAVSPYYDLKAEYRLITLDSAVLLAYEKTNPYYRGSLPLFNLGYGAKAVNLQPSELLQQLTDMAVQSMQLLSLRVASVDIARLQDGSLAVMEVNDGIMMEHYARQSTEYKKRAEDVYGAIVSAMF
jgi:hypothetical protein